jgi:hypothetical protein
MTIEIDICDISKIDQVVLQKMVLLYNALEDGWDIKKKNDIYIFSKKHGGKKEVFLESYLHTFMKDKFDINKIITGNNNN